MTERTRNEKTLAQDATGLLFGIVGVLFAVSIVLFLLGQEPKESFKVLTSPVVELVTRLGSPGALAFSAGLASLGAVLFARSSALSPLRPLATIVLAALGLSLITGAFGGGGQLGAWLPGLMAGFAGRVLAVVLGAALAWLAWTLFSTPRPRPASSAELVQRIGLGARSEAASGVSPAEAALLGPEPRTPVRPLVKRDEPARTGTIRPYTPAPEPAPETRAVRLATPIPPPAVPEKAVPARALPASDTAPLIPPSPSWETSVQGEVQEEVEEEDEARASAAEAADELADDDEELTGEVDTGEVETDEVDTDELEEELTEPLAAVAAAFEGEVVETDGVEEGEQEEEDEAGLESADRPTAAWEQVGLFDEEEEESEETVEEPPAAKAKDLTPSFDFEAGAPQKPAHEPEEEPVPAHESVTPGAFAPVVPPVALQPTAPPAVPPARPAVAPAAKPAASEPFTLKPAAAPAPKPAPVATRGDDEERWNQLVYDAGCLILEQKRVAVSMLERHFTIDFDQACRILDELQEAGLIGPYMGGRTRDILLTREEWLPHAPHATS